MSALRALAAAIVLAVALPAPHTRAAPHAAYAGDSVATYYDLQGWMRNGDWVHDGAVACPKAYLGAQITIYTDYGPVYGECDDTGSPAYFEQGYMRIDVWSASRPWWLNRDKFYVEVGW